MRDLRQEQSLTKTQANHLELEAFRDCYNLVFRGRGCLQEAVLFLHGFPAEQGNKNIDLAESLRDQFGIDAYLIHYHGLGKSPVGQFTFLRSIQDALAYAQMLIKTHGYERLHLVGHSWGGLVALNVFHGILAQAGCLVLLAPFTQIAPVAGLSQLAQYFLRSHPHIFPDGNHEALMKDLGEIFENHNPLAITPSLISAADRILIVHALEDDLIPREMQLSLIGSFGPARPHYTELNTDHRFFRNREAVIGNVHAFLGARLQSASSAAKPWAALGRRHSK